MTNVAIIDDEEFYLKLLKSSLEYNCNVFVYKDPDEFIDENINNFNKFDFIIVDIVYENRNIMSIGFSKLLRKNNFNKEIILYSNYKQNIMTLENYHFYDLFLEKSGGYSIDEIKTKLTKNRIHWKRRFQKLGIEPIIGNQ